MSEPMDIESSDDLRDETTLLIEKLRGENNVEELDRLALEHKNSGNAAFSSGDLKVALSEYSLGVRFSTGNDKRLSAVLHSNRAFVHIKNEDWGLAIADATSAIKSDPKYAKAYYRRSTAYFALGKTKSAMANMQRVVKLCPSDKDARRNFKLYKDAYTRERFEKAISYEQKKGLEAVFDLLGNVEDIAVPSDYDGPHLDSDGTVTIEFVKQLIERFKNQQSLHKKYLYQILIASLKFFEGCDTLVEVSVPPRSHINIFGDVHGQYYDLLNVFDNITNLPGPENMCLFNGDFVDRGSFSVEVMVTLLSLKLLYPNHVFLNRGNHETLNMNRVYGFEGEVKHKYSSDAMSIFTQVFNSIPLAHVINGKLFATHGGLPSTDGVTLEDIRTTSRFHEPPDKGIMADLLWSDPQALPGRAPSKRGIGKSFGPDVTTDFLTHNNLELVVRSHEVKPEGYEVHHDGKCITIFSAPNYCDSIGNKGAVLVVKFDKDGAMSYTPTPYAHVPHPSVPPMAYASGMSMMGF